MIAQVTVALTEEPATAPHLQCNDSGFTRNTAPRTLMRLRLKMSKSSDGSSCRYSTCARATRPHSAGRPVETGSHPRTVLLGAISVSLKSNPGSVPMPQRKAALIREIIAWIHPPRTSSC